MSLIYNYGKLTIKLCSLYFVHRYICVMAIFHYSEFLSIAVCNPKSLTPSSFMLNHSFAYSIAAMASWTEYLLWHYFLPGKAKLRFTNRNLFECGHSELIAIRQTIWESLLNVFKGKKMFYGDLLIIVKLFSFYYLT